MAERPGSPLAGRRWRALVRRSRSEHVRRPPPSPPLSTRPLASPLLASPPVSSSPCRPLSARPSLRASRDSQSERPLPTARGPVRDVRDPVRESPHWRRPPQHWGWRHPQHWWRRHPQHWGWRHPQHWWRRPPPRKTVLRRPRLRRLRPAASPP